MSNAPPLPDGLDTAAEDYYRRVWVNGAEWGAHRYSSDEMRRARKTALDTLNRWFMKLVSPRSFDDIVRRYQHDIAAHARTTAELWQHALTR